jgi:Spy/CpxP family protein refolding chaperone
MRKLLPVCGLLGLIVFVTTQANAQRPGGGGGFGGSLVSNKSVQEELKFTDEQKEKVKAVTDKQRGSFTKLKDLSKEERAEKMKEMFAANQKEMAAILKPEQAKRLKQIELQQSTLRSLATDDVAKELKLSDEQKEKVKTLNEEYRKDSAELRKGDRKEMAEKRAALVKETNEKAAKILTADQQTKWKEMIGTPFTVKFENPFGKKGSDN